MAGKESRGVAVAEAGLFRGRRYVLTPDRAADMEHPAVIEFRGWRDAIGARVILLDAEEHDRSTALVSHLPQLLSTALASMLSEHTAAGEVAGPAVMELTRLALSPWEIWRDIFVTNPTHIGEALQELIAKLNDYQGRFASGDLESQFASAGSLARRLRQKG